MNSYRFRATPHCYRLLAGTASFLIFTTSQAALFTKSSSDFSGTYRSGNIPAALNSVAKESTANATSKDAILWRLEQGATLRAAASG